MAKGARLPLPRSCQATPRLRAFWRKAASLFRFESPSAGRPARSAGQASSSPPRLSAALVLHAEMSDRARHASGERGEHDAGCAIRASVRSEAASMLRLRLR